MYHSEREMMESDILVFILNNEGTAEGTFL